MVNVFLIFFGKIVALASHVLNIGHGSTWPGHVAININKNFIKELIHKNPHLKIVLIAGTNGKTTTGKLIETILERANYRVFQNESGANLLNGIASSLLLHSSILCKIDYDYAIFEVDENTLPLALNEFKPDFLIILNLFRDQLDRYGEVNTIVRKWSDSILRLAPQTTLILNADDPQIAYLSGRKLRGVQANTPRRCISSCTSVFYFGLDDKTLQQTFHQHAVDSIYCPNCNSRLTYKTIYYSHLGDWMCNKCKYKRPHLDLSRYDVYPLSGTYNRYNIHASVVLVKTIGIEDKQIEAALRNFKPAFGRQEVLDVDGKRVKIFLSKNPTSFNESLKTISKLRAKNVLILLNDRIPDGRDVSWIWDVDTEELSGMESIIVSGDRAYDMGLRIKYSSSSEIKNEKLKMKNYIVKFKIIKDLKQAIIQGLEEINESDTLYILPTYSAMLEVRRILTGRKIL